MSDAHREPGAARARRPGLRLAAAAGATAVGVGLCLALQPGGLAVADVGVVPSTSGASTQAGGTGAGAASPAPDATGTVPDAGAAAGAAEGADAGGAPAVGTTGSPAPPPASPPAPAVVPVGLVAPGRDRPVEVVTVGVEPGGALEVPADPDVLGWWRSGPGAGAAAGSTVLVGHLDVPGDVGVMRALAGLPLDAALALVDEHGSTSTYRVTARRTFAKDDGLPTDLFRTDGPPQLVLVTCGGEFDPRTRHYADNVVVYAVPA